MELDGVKVLVGDELKYWTPELVAEMFAAMHSDEQAKFFNRVSEIATPWGGGFPMQLQAITDDDGLTLSGRRVMQYIGEYSHCGLVPRASN